MAVAIPRRRRTRRSPRRAARAHRSRPDGAGLPPGREQALRAAGNRDLASFPGDDHLLVAASLILTAMFFVFSGRAAGRRRWACWRRGLHAAQVRRLFMGEADPRGGRVGRGSPLGWAFARQPWSGLSSAWSGVVADTSIEFHARPATALIAPCRRRSFSLIPWRGACGSSEAAREELVAETSRSRWRPRAGEGRRPDPEKVGFSAGLLGAAGSRSPRSSTSRSIRQGHFFGAGGLLLVSGIRGSGCCSDGSRRVGRKLSVSGLGVRNAARRPGRSLAPRRHAGVGCFVVFSVSAMKENLSAQGCERPSPVGRATEP